jgi:hypothetical protein
MRIFRESEEKEEIPPIKEEKLNPEDKGLVKMPVNPRERAPVPNDVKELVAIDAAFMGNKKTSLLHGVPLKTVEDIAANTEAGQNARAMVTMAKHGIADLATAKLMQTLDLLSPHEINKEVDKISVIDGLSRVIHRMGDKKEEGQKVVHLHLYAPNQKKEDDYPIIEVA